jgi:GNAT superfamily N-acetyltransferase
MPELEAFFRSLLLPMPAENLAQFCLPRVSGTRLKVVTLVMRDEGRIVGTVGWIDVALRVNDQRGLPLSGQNETLRWPVNLYLLPESRGKGLGKQLMEATRQGAALRAVIGGNAASMPVLDRTGWQVIGHLSSVRWRRPCLDPSRLRERLGPIDRRPPPERVNVRTAHHAITARRVERALGWLPWAAVESPGAPFEAGPPRDAHDIEFAFGHALRRYHTLHEVTVNGVVAGFFALAARAERRPWLTTEVMDLDAVPGRETQVIRAARATALSCADVARFRFGGARFARALASMGMGGRFTVDHPLRVSFDPARAIDGPHLRQVDSWRLTYGDHDQYRVRSSSIPWVSSQAVPPSGVAR